MLRRSDRLCSSGYYQSSPPQESSPSVNYKEKCVRVFRKRTKHHTAEPAQQVTFEEPDESDMTDDAQTMMVSMPKTTSSRDMLRNSEPVTGLSSEDVTIRRTFPIKTFVLLLAFFIVLAFGPCAWHTGFSPALYLSTGLRLFGSACGSFQDFAYDNNIERDQKWLQDREVERKNMQKEIDLLREISHNLRLASQIQKKELEEMIKVSVKQTELHCQSWMDQKMEEVKVKISEWPQNFLYSRAAKTAEVVLWPDLQGALERQEQTIMANLAAETTNLHRSVMETLQRAVTVQDVEAIIHRALKIFKADGTGMADHALESAGGSVILGRCSPSYTSTVPHMSLFGIPLLKIPSNPRKVIQPEVYPGQCWAFQGDHGFITISLAYPVFITHVTLEHLSKLLSVMGHISSAPREFAVYGMATEDTTEGTHLGTYVYEEDGEPVQTFKLPISFDKAFKVVELKVLNNWGKKEYTCLYRFRVHGQPRPATA